MVLSLVPRLVTETEWFVRCEKNLGRRRVASGRKEEREAHIIAVPTSITHQRREFTVLSERSLLSVEGNTWRGSLQLTSEDVMLDVWRAWSRRMLATHVLVWSANILAEQSLDALTKLPM